MNQGSSTPPEPLLPYDSEVEYLESTGTQYIDTGYYPNNLSVITAKFYCEYKALSPFATRWSGANTYDTFGIYNSNESSMICYYGRFSKKKYTNISEDIKQIFEVEFGLSQLLINGKSYSISRESFSSTYPLYLFGMNKMGSLDCCGRTQIFGFTISENNNTILDLIPVRKNNIGYMYDKVSGQLFSNAGTGNFVLGNDVN